VTPDSGFRIPTGSQQPIAVRAAPDGLREGETLAEGALEVSSNAGQEQVDVRIEVHLSGQLEIEPPRLAWALGETPPALRLRNTGYAPLSVIVRPQAGHMRQLKPHPAPPNPLSPLLEAASRRGERGRRGCRVRP
jgi:hypothetical protein